jgi:hypothetical protein
MYSDPSDRKRRTGRASVRAMGRLLQIVGLVLPPLAILMQIMDQVSVGKMLTMCVASLSMFYIGRLLEGYAQR